MGTIAERVREAGVVGAGGAGFPTHVKIAAKVNLVIANGAECEPFLYADQYVMAERADLVVEGLRLVMEETGAPSGVIALKRKYREATAALRKAVKGKGNITLHLMESFYPAGDEQVLVHEVTGRIVPEGGIPLQAGIVVSNVGTLVQVALAQAGVPFIERVLTVNGEVRTPTTMSLPVGVSLREAIELAGGASIESYRVLVGGVMMAKVADSLDAPVTKTTSGIVVLPADHPFIARKTAPMQRIIRRGMSTCDQCMYCTELCPRYLLGHDLKPHLVIRAAGYGIADAPVVTSTWLCCECGLCSFFSCPLYLSPGMLCSAFKKEMAEKGVRNPHHRAELSPHDARAERKVPTHRLIERLGLADYDRHAPFRDVQYAPQSVRIPLCQHIGAPAAPVVRNGDTVKAGTLIGEIPEGKLGARVHASIDGTVSLEGRDAVIGRM